MDVLEKLFAEIDAHHNSEPCVDELEINQFEKIHNYQFPADLKRFYRKYKSVRLFDTGHYTTYQFVSLNEIHPTRIDIFGEDTDEFAPSNWLTICDVMDGNYIAIDITSKKGDDYNFIDCFHETFGMHGENMIIAKSFTELLNLALRNGGENVYYLNRDFNGYGFE